MVSVTARRAWGVIRTGYAGLNPDPPVKPSSPGAGIDAGGVILRAHATIEPSRFHASFTATLWPVSDPCDSPSGTLPKPPIKPLDVDGVTATAVGTVAWTITLLVLLLFFREQLAAQDATWWIWVCAAGIALGLIGLLYTLRRRAVYRRAAVERRLG